MSTSSAHEEEPAEATAATAPAKTFDALGLDLRLLKAVKKLGLTKPTRIQAECVPHALAGKDVLARAPTGSGKTYAYALPLLQKVLGRHDAGATSLGGGVGAIVLVPTRELCHQVHEVMSKLLGHAGTAGVRVAMLATPSDAASLDVESPPDALVATPARLRVVLKSGLAVRESVHTLVVDEADLLLAYGYGDDLAAIGGELPQAVQTLLLSATITPDLDSIRALFLTNPVAVAIEDEDEKAEGKLRQFWLRCSHADKFLVMYALFKLNRIPGRSLIFVNSVDRGFRLKLFLEQFGVSSGVLNCELPLTSRWHAIQAFNQGVFDILIATDDPKLMAGRAAGSSSSGGSAAEDAEATGGGKKGKKRARVPGGASAADAEFGVSRGVDFSDVTAVLNMDLPDSLAVYKHRIGRTARAGKGGTAISLVSPDSPDEALLETMLDTFDGSLHQFQVDMTKLAAFKYRTEDALRAVTRHAVKEARLAEIKRELMHSKKLAAHFESNPEDLQMLRHDKPLTKTRKLAHLAHVPTYLKPETDGATAEVAAIGSSSRRLPEKRRKLYGGKGKHAKSKRDPLKSFKSAGGPKQRKGRKAAKARAGAKPTGS